MNGFNNIFLKVFEPKNLNTFFNKNIKDGDSEEFFCFLKEQISIDWSEEIRGKIFLKKNLIKIINYNQKNLYLYFYQYRSRDNKKQYYAFGSRHKVIGLFKETEHIWSSIKDGKVSSDGTKYCKICGVDNSIWKGLNFALTCDENLIKEIVI